MPGDHAPNRPTSPRDPLPHEAYARNLPPPKPAAPKPLPGGIEIAPNVKVPERALVFTFARSSGPGGQNVNKVSTKAILRVALADLPLAPDTATRLRGLATYRLTASDDLLISCEAHRSQEANRQHCLDELRRLLIEAAIRPKKRRPTKRSKGANLRRLTAKKMRGETKRLRRPDE